MQRICAILILAAATGGTTACYRVSSYDGDGRLTDLGWSLEEGHRYRLDLGELDFSAPASHTYRVSNLPNGEFTVGVQVVEPEPIRSDDTHQDHTSYVRVELRTSDGQLVILEEGPLSSWTWSYALGDNKAFLYRRGESLEIPLADGATTGERVGVKAAGGWGTYFTATTSTTYVLKVEIIDPRGTVKRPAGLMMDGYG